MKKSKRYKYEMVYGTRVDGKGPLLAVYIKDGKVRVPALESK